MSRVLLVEDEPQIRRFVRLALEGQGCERQGVGNGGLRLARSR
jgi:DNA-binding response OmpR family regulator